MKIDASYAFGALLGLILCLSVLVALQSRRLNQQAADLAKFKSQHTARVLLLETFHAEETAVIDRRIDHED